MKWFKENWFILLIIGAAIFFFWEWQCNAPKVKSVEVPVEDTARAKQVENHADSLVRQINVQMASIDQLTDSLARVKKTVKSLIARVREGELSLGISGSGIISMDSAGYNAIFGRCDSLGGQFNDYILLSEAKQSKQDSVIVGQVVLISTKDSLIMAKQQFNDLLKASFKQTTDGFARIDNNYQKKLQWQKVKQKILVGIIVAEAAKIVYDSARK